MKIWVLKSSQTTAEKTLKRFKTSITDRYKGRILGPAPSFYRKTGGKYSWQIIFLSPSRKQLVEIAKNLPKDVYYDLDPVSLL